MVTSPSSCILYKHIFLVPSVVQIVRNKQKMVKWHIVRTFPKSNRKIVETWINRYTLHTCSCTSAHFPRLHDPDTSIKRVCRERELVLYAQSSLFLSSTRSSSDVSIKGAWQNFDYFAVVSFNGKGKASTHWKPPIRGW